MTGVASSHHNFYFSVSFSLTHLLGSDPTLLILTYLLVLGWLVQNKWPAGKLFSPANNLSWTAGFDSRLGGLFGRAIYFQAAPE